MNLLNRLERKFGRFAIQRLISYIIGANVVVFFLSFMDPTVIRILALDPQMVLQGEFWRLVTFLFIPPTLSIFFAIFVFYFYYMVGMGLEAAWGSFRFNVYYLIGAVATVAVSLLTGGVGTPVYLNLSLFLAFATLYPEHEVRLFLILPVKVKYLGLIYAAVLLITLLTSPVPVKVMALASLLNYLLFFAGYIISTVRHRKNVSRSRKRYLSRMPRQRLWVHRCTVCGITEEDDPQMDFRYCSRCEGDYEYCMEHLRDHEHKKDTV